MERRKLAEDDTVYWAGCSSGARGAMFNFEYVPDMLPPGVTVFGLFDSPLWVDVEPLSSHQTPLRDQVEAVLLTMGASTRLGETCAELYPADDWKCLMAEYRAPLLQRPYFLIASQYDSALLKKNLGRHDFLPIPGLWDSFYEPPYDKLRLKYADMLRRKTRQTIARVLEASSAAVFSTACYEHCLSDTGIFQSRAVAVDSEVVPLNRFLADWMAGGAGAHGEMHAVEDCAGFNCGCRRVTTS